jgi:hypothetical protein
MLVFESRFPKMESFSVKNREKAEGEIIEISHRAIIPMEFQEFHNNSKNSNGILYKFLWNSKNNSK